MTKKEEEAREALKKTLEMVESIRASGMEAFEGLIAMKAPCNPEVMQLGMLLQASLSFSVALKKNWIELCDKRQAMIIEMNGHKGN